MKTELESGSYWCVVTIFHTSSKETWTMLAPNLSIALSLVSGASLGTITVHGIPRCRDCQARACAMFPALQVYTPFDLASGPASGTALLAPRTLNEPVGCRFSSLR